MTKLIYLGCLSSSRYMNTCENAVKIVKFLDPGYSVIENAPCCGSLSFHISSEEELKKHINSVNDWFKQNDVTDIVTICAGCYNYLTNYYKKFLPEFNIKVQHILQLIANPENLKKLNLKYTGKKIAVNYHDPCHLKNAITPIIDEPRKILESIENIELKEMENTGKFAICCGAGGGVYSEFKENSDVNALAVFDQTRRTKALLTSCPFCYTAFKRIQEDNKIKVPVIKFEDFIVKLMEGVDPVA